MRIYKYDKSNKEQTVSELTLDEHNEFHELSCLAYEIHLTVEEYKKIVNIIEPHILKAIYYKIEVYCAYERANKFMIIGNELVTSTCSIISFSTTDVDKYEILENIVKDVINEVRKVDKEKDKNTFD